MGAPFVGIESLPTACRPASPESRRSSPMPNVSDFLIHRLTEWGVDRIYGYPGDGINGIIGALGRAGDDVIEFVQVRHEEMAAFMACAHAKFTGEVGRLSGNVGAGRDPSAERPVRRKHGPSAGRRDRRAAGAARRSAATTSRRSICSLCSRTSRSEYVQMARRRRRCATSSIARCASRWPSARSRASSCPTTSRRWTQSRTAAARTAPSTPASATRSRA